MKVINVYDNFKLYKNKTFQINKGITYFVGKNGAGKSTLLFEIKQFLNKEGINYFYYSNYTDGGNTAKDKYLSRGNIEALSSVAFHSEGEQIHYNFGQTLYDIGCYIRTHKNDKEIWILLDALDSGLSINLIREIKDVFKLICSDNKDKELYIVNAGNCYELAIDTDCIDVSTAEHITFDSYEQYCHFICKKEDK